MEHWFFFCVWLSMVMLVKTLALVSTLVIFLQLLNTQIGISGHIHRLMAGSMAGRAFPFTSVPGTLS